MTLRHTAAAALIGWYLILPPMNRISESPRGSTSRAWSTDVQARLKDWQITESFGAAADCEIARDETIADSRRSERIPTLASGYFRAFRIAESRAQCIASDDPRLAK